MKSDNPESGIYEADSARTLDLNGGNPACNQGGMAVVQGADVYNGELTGEVAASLTTASGISNGSGPKIIGADVYNGDVTGDVAPSVTTKTGEPGSSGPKAMIFTQNEREEVRDLKDVAGAISAESGTHQQNYVMQSIKECLNSWDVQSKHSQPEDGIAESLYSGECRYGGGESYVLQNQKEPVLLESSQNHATVQTDGISTTLPASMGEGGGYVPMVCIEGNGSRDSHKGDGYSESETMYTLNTVEQHAVAYAPETYQKTTGALMASGYSKLGTQEAANDMYVVQQPTVQSMELFHCTTEENKTAPLKARDYKDPQVVVQSAGFCTEHSAKAHNIGYQEECAPTLREGTVPATIYESKAVESHAQDARYNVGDVNQTLGANMEHDAANGGLVYAVDQGGGKSGCNIETDKTPTLTTTHGGEPAICYSFQGQTGGSVDMPIGENITPTLISNQLLNVAQPTAFKKSSHAKSADDGQGWESTEVNDTLNAFDNGETRTPTLVLNDQGGQQMQVSEDQTATLRAEEHGHQPLVFDASRRHDYRPFGDVAETVQAQYGTGGNNTPMVMDMLNLNPQETEKSMTLNAYNGTGGNNMPMVFENHSQDTRYNAMGETCQTVSATWGMGGNNQPLEVKPQQAVVRRLTCLECERLQGFPDFWTDIGEWVDSKGKRHKPSDSPRYKALGNSIALPFWDWMAERMVAQLKKSGIEHPTMSSLFDGIAGFPYVYIRHGCTPVWTSEIEEFPIAVCKKHFGDEETGEVGDIEEYLKLPVNWATSNNPIQKVVNAPISFDRAAFNQGANAKYDFSVEEDTAQTLVARGPGGVCQ